MRGRELRIRRVRRYRGARYPSGRAGAKRGGSPTRRVLRAAAGPALALGLGVAGGAGCDEGTHLAGEEPDALGGETVEAAAEDAGWEAGRDDAAAEDLSTSDEASTPDDAAVPEDSGPDGAEPDYGWEGDMMPGTYFSRILSELDARTLIAGVVDEVTGAPTGPCASPTLAERLLPDTDLLVSGARLNVDLLAPELAVEATPECPGGLRPAVGFEFKTDEEWDDEDLSGRPEGVTDAEERVLAELDAAHRAHVRVLPSTDYAYTVIEYEDGWTDDSDRARAERLLGDTVREILDGLRRDGCI